MSGRPWFRHCDVVAPGSDGSERSWKEEGHGQKRSWDPEPEAHTEEEAPLWNTHAHTYTHTRDRKSVV